MDNLNKEKTREDIYNYLKEGMYKKDAALMAGIDESTLYRWIEADASFASRVEASILLYKHSLIKIINTCAEKDGRLALEVLRRRFPDIDDRVEDKGENERSTKRIADMIQAMLQEGHEKQSNGEMKVLP